MRWLEGDTKVERTFRGIVKWILLLTGILQLLLGAFMSLSAVALLLSRARFRGDFTVWVAFCMGIFFVGFGLHFLSKWRQLLRA